MIPIKHPRASRRISWLAIPVLVPMMMVAAASFAMAAPVALILNCAGKIVPVVVPYTEVSAGTKLKLERGARLEFLDYNSCVQVTESGGEVDFSSTGYTAKGGIESEQRVACPQKLTLSRSGEISGNVLRGGDSGIELPTRPNLVLAGARRGSFATMRILKDGQQVMQGQLERGHFNWPSNEKSLDPASSYELDLIPGQGEVVKKNFRTGSVGDQQAVVLIHTD